jgi:hypothetical protein
MSTLKANVIQTIAGKTILNGPGGIIKTVYVRSDSRTSYASNASGNGTTITPLGLTITPTSATNRIICQWMINGEMNQDNVFLIHSNSALITTAGEEGRNSVSNNIWVGYAAGGFYDNNDDSTPNNWNIMYSQIAGSTTSRTYAPAVRSSSGNSTFYLNRTVSGADGGQGSYEVMVSTGVAYEVVV